MKYDVFISYSSHDQKVAEGVCAYLEQHRIRCFVAYRDIPKGVVWARAIVEALEESRMMVIVFSENFNRSEQVDREIELASEDHMPILTFRIADDAFRGAKKYYLKNLNWIDAFPQPERCFGELCKNAKQLLGIDEKETSEPEDAQSLYEQGRRYYFGNGVAQDYAEATRWFHKAAEQGHITAQYNLGCCYRSGKGVTQNKAEAIKWFRKAAEQGDASAQYNLGCCYRNGEGVAQDPTEAAKWFHRAAEQGHVHAQNNLQHCCNNEKKRNEAQNPEFTQSNREATEQEDANAQYNLGYNYFYGKGVKQDYTEAVKWFRKAAEQGLAEAQYELGICYDNGNGVSQNHTEAVKWYHKAAEQGQVDAQYRLGTCYYYGKGVKQNYIEAIRWFHKVAKQGYDQAQYALGHCYYNGEGLVQNYAEAVKWFRKAAEQGNADALEALKKLGETL